MSATLGASKAWADLTADQTPFNSFRGIWTSRFDYSTANAQSSIAGIMTNAKAMGFTDVVFQVRGQADAYYWNNNGIEVRAANVTATSDPLAIAIAEAHSRGLRLHAWINAMPLWSASPGTSATSYTPQAPANHLINTHPEYWIRDANNNPLPFPSGGGYVTVNPARDDVRQHVNNVVNAIASNYAIDGINLDYIRLTQSNPGAANPLEFPADPFTVSLFQQQYPGQTPTSNPANFKAFMADKITTLVGSIRDTLKAARPNAQLTADVWRDADIGLDEYQQDWARWVDQGLLDAAFPMIYRKGFGTGTASIDADSGDLYRNNVAEAMSRRGTAGIMIGVGSYMQNNAATAYNNVIAQLNYAKAQGANGVQIYNSGTLFNGSAAQNEVKRALTDFFAANSGVAPMTTLANFDADEGSFKWPLTLSGSNQNVAASSSADFDNATSHTGLGSQKIVINKAPGAASFLARHLSGNGTSNATVATFDTNTPFVSIGSVGFWLKTNTRDLQVSVALDDTVTGDRGYLQNVVADGQWHKYEWFLADPTHWDAWIAAGDGHLNNVTTLDSIQFFGTADTNTIYLDDVFYNPSAIAANQWTFDADNGTWSNSGHWTGGVPNGVGVTANLLRRATTNRAVVLDTPVTLGTLNLENIQSYTLSGSNSLTLDVGSGSAAINVVNRGSHVIATPLSLKDNTSIFVDRGSTLTIGNTLDNGAARSITKSGDGLLEISGTQNHAPGSELIATAGTTRFSSNGGPNLAVSATSTGVIEFAVSQSLASLSLSGSASASLAQGRKVLSTRGFSVAQDAKIDLTDGALIHDYGSGSPLFDTRAKIVSGTISSSAVDSAHALGYGEASALLDLSGAQTASYLGQTVDATTLIVRYTFKGDANLDGAVDFNDLVRLAQGYGDETGNALWSNGDFTQDGRVDFSDLVALAQNYNSVLPTPGAVPASLDAAWPAALAVAPEPDSLAVLGMIVSACARRRRRIT